MASEYHCQIEIQSNQETPNIFDVSIKGPKEKLAIVSDKLKDIVESIKTDKTEWMSEFSTQGKFLKSTKDKKEITELQESNKCLLQTIGNIKDDW